MSNLNPLRVQGTIEAELQCPTRKPNSGSAARSEPLVRLRILQDLFGWKTAA